MSDSHQPRFSESEKTRQLVSALLKKRGISLQQKETISPRPVHSPCPASFAQTRLWLLEQLAPGSRYNMQFALRLKGPVNFDSLNQAWQEIARRHEILRTTFGFQDEEVMQFISPDLKSSLVLLDLTKDSHAERESMVQHLLGKQAAEKFDLATGPLVRPLVLKLGMEDFILSLTMHHIIADGWSLVVLIRELTELYTAFNESRPHRLPPVVIQYADFAWWQRQRLRGEFLERQLSYWRRQLSNAPILDLPTDHPHPQKEEFHGAHCNFQIPKEVAEKLRELGRRNHASLFMVLLAAWQTLLYRYSGQSDIVVGAPIANRTRMEIESLIGFFVNTLVLRTVIDGNLSFKELLSQVSRTTLDAYEHQDVPYEKLVAELQPERTASQTPFFGTVLNWVNMPDSNLEFAGMQSEFVQSAPLENLTAKFDLSLNVMETGGALPAGLEYSTDLYKEATIQRMGQHLQNLLGAAAANPDQPVAELPLIEEEERSQILWKWNQTRREYPDVGTLLSLLEAQAQKTPENPAVVFEGRSFSYRELHQRTNQLARFLMKLGVGPEFAVGVCMKRSLELVIALLGTMKAGGAYLPLDPSYPAERLKYMLYDSAPAVVLVGRGEREKLAGLGWEGQVVCVEEAWEEIWRESQEAVESRVGGENLAYVIYTSGSTGQPKGVMNVHGGLLNRLQWMQEIYPLDENDRVLQKTPFGFDISLWEFLWPLMYGGCLVVARPEGHKDSQYLVRTIQQEKITLLHFVPSMLGMFLQEADVEDCTSLRRVFSSGEALPINLVQKFHKRLHSKLHNLYGPTEASIEVSFWDCAGDREEASVPIGRPIANTQLYVLDSHLQPAPIGFIGELYIGGVALARGYWRRPELTAEKFIPDPFSGRRGGRLYRTGDLARWRGDGEIECLGRTDHQVKLRGFRIELGEIEAILRQHESVQQALVVVQDEGKEKKLIAYVVPLNGGELSQATLRSYVQEKLPEYMAPVGYVELKALPLSAHGKVNRKELPRWEFKGGESKQEQPRTPTEELVAGIWSEVLGVERIGIHDNFFERGGHSLLAMQVISRLRSALQVELPFSAMFEALTINRLAAQIESSQREKKGDLAQDKAFRYSTPREMTRFIEQQEKDIRRSAVVCMNKGSDEVPPLYFMFPISGNILCYADLALFISPKKPFYAIQALPDDLKRASVEEIAAASLPMIQKRGPKGSYELGGWSFGGMLAFEMAQQATAAGDPPAALYLLDPPVPENLSENDQSPEGLVGLFVLTLIADFGGGKSLNVEELKTKFDLKETSLEVQLRRAAKLGLLPARMDPSKYAQSFEIFKRNMRAAHVYRPQKYSGKTQVILAEMGRSEVWPVLSTANTSVARVPGNHFTMLRGASAARIAQLLDSGAGAVSL